MDNRWQDIYMFLKEKGVEVYEPAQHEGECKSKYVVLKSNGANQYLDYSTSENYYSLLCYVPREQYSQLETYKDTIKSYMKELEDTLMIRDSHYEAPAFYDDKVKAHMTELQYNLYKKF